MVRFFLAGLGSYLDSEMVLVFINEIPSEVMIIIEGW